MYSPKSGDEPKSLRARLSLPDGLKLLLAVLMPNMLPSKSESGEVLVTYSPQRLLRQFEFDQGAVLVSGNTCIGFWEVEFHYGGEGRGMLMGDFNFVFWPCKAREAVRSPEGALY